MRTLRAWTTTELATLRDLASRHSAREIGAKLGRTRRSVLRVATRHAIRIPRIGERHHLAKFTEAQVRAVRDMHTRKVPHIAIARGLGMSEGYVSAIVTGKRRAKAAP